MILYKLFCCLCLLLGSVHCHTADRTAYTLPGNCIDLHLQQNLQYTNFSGTWYNTGSFASDNRTINQCSTMEFTEDNMGYIYTESYVAVKNESRMQMFYSARVDPTFDAANRGKFIISYETDDHILQYPFYILATDYNNYAITYTCKNNERKAENNMHYVYVWVLTRSKEKIDEDIIAKSLSKYPELAEYRKSFVYESFSNATCEFDSTDNTFSTNFS